MNNIKNTPTTCGCMENASKFGIAGETGCCGSGEMGSAMAGIIQECMGKCRWLPLIIVTLGFTFLLLGHYLDADIVWAAWMILSWFAVILGGIAFIMMSIMIRKFRNSMKDK